MGTLGKDSNSYYRFHSKIYDLTRWTFLFGRSSLVSDVAKLEPKKVLEIGCGTGRNLIELKRLCPDTICVGVDASPEMLAVAKRKSQELKMEWIQGTYPSPSLDHHLKTSGRPSVIIFSYALSMFNPGWEESLEQAHRDVDEGGTVCLVDFHHSSKAWFRTWMSCNHVRIEGHLQRKLNELGLTETMSIRRGLLGLWEWMTYTSRPFTVKGD